MVNIEFSLIVLSVLIHVISAVPGGQKVSLLRVPFIAYGQGMYRGKLNRFAGVILNEKLVLTSEIVAQSYENVRLYVGLFNVYQNQHNVPEFRVHRAEYNDHVALLEIFSARFIFSPIIQKACIMDTTRLLHQHYPIPIGKKVYLAAYGSTNWFNNVHPHELHGMTAVVNYKNISEEDSKFFFYLCNPKEAQLGLNEEDIGGPVFDMDTGEVFGILRNYVKVGDKFYFRASSLGEQRYWIQTMRDNLDKTRAKFEREWLMNHGQNN